MVQVAAPSRPIPGSMATASLLAYILVSKFDDHLPLYRLNEIFARMGRTFLIPLWSTGAVAR
jgi:transposase